MGGGGLAQGLGIRLFAFGGAYWPLATAHSDPLWARTCFGCVKGAPGLLVLFDDSRVGCPRDGLLPVPLTRCMVQGRWVGGGGGGLAQGLGIWLFAFGGAYWPLILTLCGPERVLVVSTEPLDDLSCLTTPGSAVPEPGCCPCC